MTVTRITPLPMYYRDMKMDYFTHWQVKGFKGYQSPWLPVCESNSQFIARGDLVFGKSGVEYPFLCYRDSQRIEGGKVVDEIQYPLGQPAFVWVDARKEDVLKYLKDNPFADRYKEYSRLMEEALRGALIGSELVVEDVRFPLFHETSFGAAQNILINGIDIGLAISRKCHEYGAAFCACIDLERTIGLGNFSGAVVRFDAWKGTHPRWISSRPHKIHYFLGGSRWAYDEPPFYTFRTVCSEVCASSIVDGVIVFIYDSFEQYMPVEIIRTPER